MARKRMFDSEIISQDSFIELPMEAKALYFLLGMEADDEGFVNYKKVLRLYGGMEDSVKILAMKKFIIPFSSGVIVITDWKRNNYLDKNRLKETIYQDEKNQLKFNQITEKYELLLNPYNSSVKQMFNKCLTSIDECSIEESSIEENRVDADEKDRQEYQTSSSATADNSDRQEDKTTLSQIDINIFEYLESNFARTISPSEIEQIHLYQNTFTEDIIKEAIDRACANNVKNVRYIIGILNSWKSKGFKTLEQCKKELKQNNNSKNQEEPLPEWVNEEIKSKKATPKEVQEMQALLEEFK